MMTWWQTGFQDSCSPLMEEFIFFHDFSMIILLFIISEVFIVMVMLSLNKYVMMHSSENQILETVWTLIPGVVLIQLAIPSLSLLYMLEEDSSCMLTIKALGHQWYWSYEYNEFNNPIMFDSYMNQDSDFFFRLLDVDNRVPLPMESPIRVLISSADVLHSWTVPSLGVKADASPGRINQVQFLPHRAGVYFGQCSEICGANHSFMPIVIEVISMKDFIKWVLM